jgi:hydrogenase nickel incorporation protein HypA/HybF
MHEISVAQTIVNEILAEAERQSATKVTRVVLELGKLTMLNFDQVSFWVSAITPVDGSIECRECKAVTDVVVEDDPTLHYSVPQFTCVQCGSHNTFICKGREMVIKTIRIER